MHLALIAGIIMFAAGAKSAVEDAVTPLAIADRSVLCGGVALYLAGHAAFQWRLVGELKIAQLLAAALCLAPIALRHGPPWLTLAWIATILAVFTVYEITGSRAMRAPTTASAPR